MGKKEEGTQSVGRSVKYGRNASCVTLGSKVLPVAR